MENYTLAPRLGGPHTVEGYTDIQTDTHADGGRATGTDSGPVLSLGDQNAN